MNLNSCTARRSSDLCAVHELGPLYVWVYARQAWLFVSWSGGERGRMHGFLKSSYVVEGYEMLKDSHVSTRIAFMWDSLNLRVSWFRIHFIISLPYIWLSFKYIPLSLFWSCTVSPAFRVNPGCGESKRCSITFHQNGCHGHHRVVIGNCGYNRNIRRIN